MKNNQILSHYNAQFFLQLLCLGVLYAAINGASALAQGSGSGGASAPAGSPIVHPLHCELNSNPPGVDLPESEYQKNVKAFQFSGVEGGPGTSAQNKEVKALLWVKNQRLYAMIKELKGANLARASFLPFQKEVDLQLGDMHSLKCSSKNNVSSTVGQASLKARDLTPGSDLFYLRPPFQIAVKKSFLVQFAFAGQEMWVTRFQLGQTGIGGQGADEKLSRCFFSGRPKVQRGVWVSDRDHYEAINVSETKSGQHRVWSVSFVDFEHGEVKNDSPELTPFALECIVVGGEKGFTLQEFHKIVGPYLAIE